MNAGRHAHPSSQHWGGACARCAPHLHRYCAFDAATGAFLYESPGAPGFPQFLAFDDAANVLVAMLFDQMTFLDPDTLTATGSLTVTGHGVAQAVEVDTDGTTFLAYDELYVVDRATGVATLRGGFGLGGEHIVSLAAACDVAHAEVLRAGVPANPAALVPHASDPPVLGATWDPYIDHTTFVPNAVVDLLLVGFSPANMPTPFGTQLCTFDVLLGGLPGEPFEFRFPMLCELVGVPLTCQGACLDAAFAVRACDAVDIVIGTR